MWKLLNKKKEKKSSSLRDPPQASSVHEVEESNLNFSNHTAPPLGRRVVDAFRTPGNGSNRDDKTNRTAGLKNAIIQNVRRNGSFESSNTWTVKERDQRLVSTSAWFLNFICVLFVVGCLLLVACCLFGTRSIRYYF